MFGRVATGDEFMAMRVGGLQLHWGVMVAWDEQASLPGVSALYGARADAWCNACRGVLMSECV